MNRQKGFTLVEAAVAIGVVATLSGIVIPLAMKSLQASRIARTKNDVHVIAAAIAKQLQDTGIRPRAGGPPGGGAVGGPGGSTGFGDAEWYSHGTAPQIIGAGGVPLAVGGANTFQNLFTAPNNNLAVPLTTAQGNALFNLQAAGANDLTYRGPYLGSDMALKSDPWGSAYIILGYNQNGQTHHGPIWVVSAGSGKQISVANTFINAAGEYPSAWNYAGASATNIAVRVQ